MTAPLLPCLSCARHVRSSEAQCPFCNAALPDHYAEAQAPEAFPRMSRAAMVVFSAALTATAACGAPQQTTSNPVVVQQPSPTPVDNGGTIIVVRPPVSPTPQPVDPVIEPPSPAPAYGLPPGPVVTPTTPARPRPPRDPGMPAARYGAPPRFSGPDDPGTVHAMYGVPTVRPDPTR